jgi:hypothetical protein
MSVATACACGQPATANGRECGRCFRERLLSLRLDTSVTESRSRRNYYDAEPIHETFGEDASERVMEATQGYGVAKPGPDGRFYHKDRKTSEIVPLSDDEVSRVYLDDADG